MTLAAAPGRTRPQSLLSTRTATRVPNALPQGRVASRRIPDGRGVGAVGDRHRHVVGHLDAVTLLVVGGPARRRDLDHAHVVERALRRIERRVLPVRRQHRGADGVGVGRVRHVHGVADRGLAAAIRADLAPAGDRHVEDALLRLAVLAEPALDDLDAVEVGAVRIAQRMDQEDGSLAGRRLASDCRPSARRGRSRSPRSRSDRGPPARSPSPRTGARVGRSPVVA